PLFHDGSGDTAREWTGTVQGSEPYSRVNDAAHLRRTVAGVHGRLKWCMINHTPVAAARELKSEHARRPIYNRGRVAGQSWTVDVMLGVRVGLAPWPKLATLMDLTRRTAWEKLRPLARGWNPR